MRILSTAMNEKKFLISIIACSMLILLLLLVDTYLVPATHYEPEVIVSKKFFRGISRKFRSRYTYTLKTQYRSITIRENLYRELMPGDTIFINFSGILFSPQYLLQRDGDDFLKYQIGYIRAAAGLELIIGLLIGNIITLIFFNRFPWAPGRKNLVIVLLTLSIIQLCFCLFYLN